MGCPFLMWGVYVSLSSLQDVWLSSVKTLLTSVKVLLCSQRLWLNLPQRLGGSLARWAANRYTMTTGSFFEKYPSSYCCEGVNHMTESRPMSQSRTIQTKLVLPPDTNHLHTMFGGKVVAYI